MAELLKYSGIDLPVYPADTEIAYTMPDMEKAAEERDSFVRAVKLSNTSEINNLTEVLSVADSCFDEVAKGCWSAVAKHSWGLYKVEDTVANRFAANQRNNLLLPTDHILVAEVEAIKPHNGYTDLSEPSFTECQEINESISRHLQTRRVNHRPYWGDAQDFQFVSGVSLFSGKIGLTLIDIEPIIMQVRGN